MAKHRVPNKGKVHEVFAVNRGGMTARSMRMKITLAGGQDEQRRQRRNAAMDNSDDPPISGDDPRRIRNE